MKLVPVWFSRTCLFALSIGLFAGSVAVVVADETPDKAAANAPTVLNPNLAGAEQLAAHPEISQELAKSIVDVRPFLTMKAFDTLLAKKLDEETRRKLYVSVFVPINLNTASREEILLVPGVGKRMAHEFEEYRPYKAIAQFRREMGKYVDDEEIARYERYVFLPIDLNTATREQILAIPGVGKRMAHEFEEYRPYKSMAQFRREIGKYVDEKEVARLERYVEIR